MKVPISGVVLVLGLLLVSGVATAQPQPQAPNESNATDQNQNQIYDELGNLVVESVEYESGQFDITVRWGGTLSTQVSLTELIQLSSGGSQDISIQQQTVIPDESTTIQIAAEKQSGTASVILTTPESLDSGNALLIQSGEPTSRDPVPFDLAALSVVASALIGVAISIVLVVRKKNAEERGKKRIA